MNKMTNKVNITMGGVLIPLVFGTWVIGQLLKSGVKLDKLQESMQDDIFNFVPKIAYLAACNAKGGDTSAYKEHDFYGWVDEVGGIASEPVKEVINKFAACFGQDVPQEDEQGNVKKPPKKK